MKEIVEAAERMEEEVAQGSQQVWVVDDDETTLLLAREILHRAGFQVKTFPDAQQALQACDQALPDIFVLDVMMPGMNGFEFCSRLRRLPRGHTIPVLVTTSLDDPESIDRAYLAGATDFAAKPINWMIETHRLRYLLRAAEVAKQLRQKERETRLAKEDWERTFNSIRDMVTVLDTDLHILKINSTAAEILGRPVKEVLGKACYEVFQGINEPCRGCPVLEAKEIGAPRSAEMCYRQPGGEWLVTASPVTDQQGRLTHAVHVARDLTEQKKLEASYRQAQKMEAVGTLAGGIAHDFNNLLQVVVGAVELLAIHHNLERGNDSEVWDIVQAAKRGSALARQLLTFSRRGTGQSEKKPLQLNQAVQDVRSMLERILPKTVSVVIDLAPDLERINADAGQVQQILMNLAVNASQAMPEGGTLTITTSNALAPLKPAVAEANRSAAQTVLLEVSDTGHGMSEKIRERIYDPFFSTKDVGQGSGLGLSVAYGITREHEGTIVCRSQPGQGTTFKIQFPALKREVEFSEDTPPMQEPVVGGTETIMIVDDEAPIRNMVGRHLTGMGYTVITAADGESALRIYQAKKPNPRLVILDLGMPGLSGWECLDRLRRLDPQVKVLLATGYGGNEVTKRAIQQGATGLVTKPFSLRDLSAEAREVLDKDKVLPAASDTCYKKPPKIPAVGMKDKASVAPGKAWQTSETHVPVK